VRSYSSAAVLQYQHRFEKRIDLKTTPQSGSDFFPLQVLLNRTEKSSEPSTPFLSFDITTENIYWLGEVSVVVLPLLLPISVQELARQKRACQTRDSKVKVPQRYVAARKECCTFEQIDRLS
jgi:hypothetical protein